MVIRPGGEGNSGDHDTAQGVLPNRQASHCSAPAKSVHAHVQTHSSSVAVCTAPLFLLSFSESWQLQQCKMIPLRNMEHTRQVLEILEFYPLHGVNMCADTVQAFKTDHFANPDFPLLLGDHLANHHSLCKTLFSLIKWDSR